METAILTQGFPQPPAMEARDTLPPARRLLPKPVQPPSQELHQFQLPPNEPSVRNKRNHAAGTQLAPPSSAASIVLQQPLPVYNSPLEIPVPKRTTYNQLKRAAEMQSSGAEEKKRKYERKAAFNICKHCFLPKTKSFGHSHHVGELGLETFCPAVEGKEYANNDAWLEARRIANPTKKKN